MAGLYAADGSLNVTVVDGNTYTGAMAKDGSYNVVQNDGSTYKGLYHKCGAYNVVLYSSGIPKLQHSNGSWLVSETPFTVGTVKVTVVSGALT